MELSYSQAVTELGLALAAVPPRDVPIVFTFELRSVFRHINYNANTLFTIPIISIDDVLYCYLCSQSPTPTEAHHALLFLRYTLPTKRVLGGYFNNFMELIPFVDEGRVFVPAVATVMSRGTPILFTPFDFGFRTDEQFGIIDQSVCVKYGDQPPQPFPLTVPRYPLGHPDPDSQRLWRALRLVARINFEPDAAISGSRLVTKVLHESSEKALVPLAGQLASPLVAAQLLIYGFKPSFELSSDFTSNFQTYPFKYYQHKYEMDVRTAFIFEMMGEYQMLTPDPSLFYLIDFLTRLLDDENIDEIYEYRYHIGEVNYDHHPMMPLFEAEPGPLIRTGYFHSCMSILENPTLEDYSPDDTWITLQRYPYPCLDETTDTTAAVQNRPYLEVVSVLARGPLRLPFDVLLKVIKDPEITSTVKCNALVGNQHLWRWVETAIEDYHAKIMVLSRNAQASVALWPVLTPDEAAHYVWFRAILKAGWCWLPVMYYSTSGNWLFDSRYCIFRQYKIETNDAGRLILTSTNVLKNANLDPEQCLMVGWGGVIPVTSELLPYLMLPFRTLGNYTVTQNV